LEKEGITLKKNKGFTLIEVLIAATILMTVITTIVPIISLVQAERQVLSERRTLSLKLHDELQQFLWLEDITLPAAYSETIHEKAVQFTFIIENEYVKGCAEWQNAKRRTELFCLYGLPKE
jgi:prepilin-type N-terminal cleavage/methylation domain-containing protein